MVSVWICYWYYDELYLLQQLYICSKRTTYYTEYYSV